ncbi:LysR substrate-binding domain-containing protein [Parasedimentitalea huanghaiensis]|uniref:LysR family transcriptional regulator n=1 Tax=Parasedimentitalea huanghaiensis TaxID=2682100 RepID=A0A6L6W9C5_9RHOB|nr:LysR substrate-binding domain-containing protein [Zongyanglinia huanghaiensis]MVO14423.1 LysR family transcriptional regulator [Zongyanglinia huanghaiensis]
MNFTLRQLSYFKSLCQHRNFGRAAEACHVSQPALSVQIRTLEEIMGAPLVERRSRDVIQTPLGRQVLAQAEVLLDAAQVLDKVARDRGAGRRTLSLGLIPTLAPYLLPGTLSKLRSQDLQLNVQIREARTERLLSELQMGALDAVILALPTSTPGLVELPLFEDRFLLAGSASRLRALRQDGSNLRPEDLKSEQLMLLEDGHCLTDQALEVCGMMASSPSINMGAGSMATLSRLVAAGFGLTLMPELAVKSECEAANGLDVQRFPEPQPARQIGLVRRHTTTGDGWFEQLAETVKSVGQEIVIESRN